MKHLLLCVLIFLSYLTAIAGQDQVLRQKAARAEKYRSYPEVVLIDSTAVTVASTGSGSFTVYKAILVQNNSGALSNRVIRYDYDPLTAFASFKSATVYKANGEIRNLDVSTASDYTAPARSIYWGARQIMLEAGRLEPGDII